MIVFLTVCKYIHHQLLHLKCQFSANVFSHVKRNQNQKRKRNFQNKCFPLRQWIIYRFFSFSAFIIMIITSAYENWGKNWTNSLHTNYSHKNQILLSHDFCFATFQHLTIHHRHHLYHHSIAFRNWQKRKRKLSNWISSLRSSFFLHIVDGKWTSRFYSI